MLNRLWEGLQTRIQTIARNKGQCDGVTCVQVTLFFRDGDLVGWYKPARIPMEPKQFPLECLPIEKSDKP
jgi:hypothetical protein